LEKHLGGDIARPESNGRVQGGSSVNVPEPATSTTDVRKVRRSAPERAVQPKRRRWIWVILAVAILAGIVGLVTHRRSVARLSKAKSAQPPPGLLISTAVARKGDIGIYINALGTVTPVYTVMLKSRVDGQLMSVNYTEGQTVQQGDLLVEIDPRPFQAQLTQAEGQLARDKALLENARVDLDRYQTAYSKNAIPKQQLDTQVASVHQYEGAVKFDQGQVDTAKLQLTYSHITAPISGRVGLRLVDPGNIVHATDTNPLAVITQLQPITVVFNVPEDNLPEIQQQLQQGNKLTVTAFDRAQQRKLATGTLLTLDNQIDPGTGTVKLKALFPNEDNSLFPNQFVNARLLVSTEHDVTLVATPSIQHNPQGAFVYVLQTNQTVSMHPITVGAADGNVTAVEGLTPGAIVAADNFNRLQDGVKVTVRSQQANAQKAPGPTSGLKPGGAQGRRNNGSP
jgi:multidrug efflux system membrane fusion protein